MSSYIYPSGAKKPKNFARTWRGIPRISPSPSGTTPTPRAPPHIALFTHIIHIHHTTTLLIAYSVRVYRCHKKVSIFTRVICRAGLHNCLLSEPEYTRVVHNYIRTHAGLAGYGEGHGYGQGGEERTLRTLTCTPSYLTYTRCSLTHTPSYLTHP
jgi:hypothetical protein